MNIGFISCFEPEYFPNFQTLPFGSDKSILDFDLVLWQIEFLHFGYKIRTEEKPSDLIKLLNDRHRRLKEIDEFLEQGKCLVLLLSEPVEIPINDPSIIDVNLIESLSTHKLGRKVLEQIRKEGDKLIKAQNQILFDHGLSRKEFDVYSFLPDYIQQPLRKYSVLAKPRSNEIDFRGDGAFLEFWNFLKSKTWCDVFFSSAIGNPLLYSKDTQYIVSTWYKHLNGYILLLPNTQFDTSEDYPTFVEAAKLCLSAFTNLANNYVEIPWTTQLKTVPTWYIDPTRLDELKTLDNKKFDLLKLIKLCEEINTCYSNDCLFAVTMLVRTIIHHVPPIFGDDYDTFQKVANNYGGGSFKKSMQNLLNSLKNIADANLHIQIREQETLPTKIQVNFSHDLDVLLAEIVRVLK